MNDHANPCRKTVANELLGALPCTLGLTHIGPCRFSELDYRRAVFELALGHDSALRKISAILGEPLSQTIAKEALRQ